LVHTNWYPVAELPVDVTFVNSGSVALRIAVTEARLVE